MPSIKNLKYLLFAGGTMLAAAMVLQQQGRLPDINLNDVSRAVSENIQKIPSMAEIGEHGRNMAKSGAQFGYDELRNLGPQLYATVKGVGMSLGVHLGLTKMMAKKVTKEEIEAAKNRPDPLVQISDTNGKVALMEKNLDEMAETLKAMHLSAINEKAAAANSLGSHGVKAGLALGAMGLAGATSYAATNHYLKHQAHLRGAATD